MSEIALLAITLMGPLTVAAIGTFGAGPRTGILGGLTTAVYVGIHSNDPFYSTLVTILVVGLAVVAGLRFGTMITD